MIVWGTYKNKGTIDEKLFFKKAKLSKKTIYFKAKNNLPDNLLDFNTYRNFYNKNTQKSDRPTRRMLLL